MAEKYKIHVGYIISILVSIIVVVVTVNWASIEGLVQYFSFALTLSSLILAILAITYAFQSTGSLSRSIEKISDSSVAIKTSADELRKTNRKLHEELAKIPGGIRAVEERVAETRGVVEKLAEKRYPQPGANLAEAADHDSLSSDVVVRFLDNSSITGLAILYAVALSKETNTAFAAHELPEDPLTNSLNVDYMLAYAISAAALGLFAFEIDAKRRWVIKDVHPVMLEWVGEKLKEKCIQASQDVPHDETDEEENLKAWLAHYNEIRGYFGLPLDQESSEVKPEE